MKSKKDKQLSLSFLILISILLLVIGIYIIYPNKKNISVETEQSQSKKVIINNQSTFKVTTKPSAKGKQEKVKFLNKDIETKPIAPSYTYNNMLDELKNYPASSSLHIIINRLIQNKGYKQDLVKVKIDETTSIGSYNAGYFDILTGEMHINKTVLYKSNTKQIIPIIAHEIEHFDTIAKLIKSMGEEQFWQFLQTNNINKINKEFWIKASKQANAKNFKTEYYKEALERYIKHTRLDLISVYADLYIMSEKIRNPIEVSAYNISDYIIDYYGLPKNEGFLRNIVKEFNKTDWLVYNISQKSQYLKNERIAIFDYLLMKSIVKSKGKYKTAFDYCVKNSNSDLTQFWKTFKNDNKSLYNPNQRIDKETYENIVNLLKETQKEGAKELTPQEITEALKYKTYTLLSNLLYNNSIKQLKNNASDFLLYGKENNTLSSEDELKLILILICIENKIYTNTGEPIPKLYYLKLPVILEEMYKPKNKAQKYFFIYNNPAFKKKYKEGRYTEQELLTKMIEDNRLYNNAVK